MRRRRRGNDRQPRRNRGPRGLEDAEELAPPPFVPSENAQRVLRRGFALAAQQHPALGRRGDGCGDRHRFQRFAARVRIKRPCATRAVRFSRARCPPRACTVRAAQGEIFSMHSHKPVLASPCATLCWRPRFARTRSPAPSGAAACVLNRMSASRTFTTWHRTEARSCAAARPQRTLSFSSEVSDNSSVGLRASASSASTPSGRPPSVNASDASASAAADEVVGPGARYS